MKYFMTEIEKQIAVAIGDFYIFKMNKQQKDIILLGIEKIEYDGDNKKIIITLDKPGVLIGEHGINIFVLNDFINEECKINATIHVIESHLQWFLIPTICVNSIDTWAEDNDF